MQKSMSFERRWHAADDFYFPFAQDVGRVGLSMVALYIKARERRNHERITIG
jgi:hypothetical protein